MNNGNSYRKHKLAGNGMAWQRWHGVAWQLALAYRMASRVSLLIWRLISG